MECNPLGSAEAVIQEWVAAVSAVDTTAVALVAVWEVASAKDLLVMAVATVVDLIKDLLVTVG